MSKFSSIAPISKFSKLFNQIAASLTYFYAVTRGLAKTTVLTLFRRSDYRRWKNLYNYLAWWASRIEKMARLIPEGNRVIEFGAGHQQLKSQLPQNCTYIPSDLVDRGPGTVICDLNKRPLPDLRYL